MTTAPPSLPPIIASRYLPIRLIAKGGMGAVYEVEHARTGEHLALKVLLSSVSSAEELERFKREARASARIKSEHVVRVTDADIAPELDGAPFLVMELLEGRDLEREAETAPPEPATVVEWLRQVARALDKAHRLGIVHRDLKPENLFLAKTEDRAPIVKILDFGIVKMIEDGPGATGSGQQLLGTPMYMAPEQVMAQRRITSATDRYSLGMVAYRLLTGESYYRGDVLTILAQLLHAQVEPPSQRHPGLGSAFDAWFLRACHRDPDLRFASASEQIEQLSAAMGLPTIAFQEAHEPIAKDQSPRSHRKIVVLVLVAGGVAAATLGGLLLSRRPRSDRAGVTPTTSVSHESPTPVPARAPAPTPPTTSPPPPAHAPPTDSPPAATSAGVSGRPRARPRHAPDPPPTAAPPEAPKAADPYADQK